MKQVCIKDDVDVMVLVFLFFAVASQGLLALAKQRRGYFRPSKN